MKWCGRCLFVSPYRIGFADTERALQREMRRLKVPEHNWPKFPGPDVHAKVCTFEAVGKDPLAIVILGSTKGRSGVEIASSLVHESVHVWQYIRKYIGESKPSKEFEAYAIQNIAETLMQAYADTLKRRA